MTVYKRSKVMFVIEVERDVNTPPEFIRATFSIAGRESPARKVWMLRNGCVSDIQLLDIVSYLDQWVTDAMVGQVGVQSTLPGSPT